MNIVSLDRVINKNKFKYFYIHSIDSTMEEAKKYIDLGHSNIIILANEQKKGYGRRGNYWVSEPGNVFCTISFKNILSRKDIFKFSVLTSVSIKQSLEYLNINNIFFKWPNDIYCNNKKISGIIQETYINKNSKDIISIGLGINFLSSPKLQSYKTTYVLQYNSKISRDKFFEIFINFFFKSYNDYVYRNNDKFFEIYKKNQMFVNTNIKIINEKKQIIEGRFLGINEDGSLNLKTQNNQIKIFSGNIVI
ncbi:MAG: Bifunctional ligase/repressor BirA [Alphaproteobacteria bacterium MarineAlpha5_Bin9]|nr:MAG: Bifunctional ligase/repressor BirA [Alphaproteobacteria bacterium MarineAlpha5_Bin9]|tara:strand:+ start:5905 stop:6654 length:750 start_codon:yes stop_codon:yes gene_type:complete